ncbi:hypothetical protein SI65_03061 [Aspergillus cristatus]|uniref:Uncharacterized protein n=1 Tax=Aspergillus cristatus TaxID=573508 RepID=A0A1E3BMN2_ASPCR|nr:hypothetical protein SI65_03061 [Aspergillus cristatus]
MSSSTLHRCPSCGQITDISTSLAAFIEDPHCSQCGLSASESSLKLQEGLAALFDRQMSMGTVEVPETPEPSSPASPTSSSQPSPITYSVSQHYHHSSHVARQAQAVGTEEQQSFGTYSAPTATDTSNILRSHNIDPFTLSPRQIELFEGAIPEQKSRLIQMWQICPDTAERGPATGTCFLNDQYQYHVNTFVEDHDMDGMAQDEDEDEDGQQYAEPYMASGYEALAQRDYELSGRKSYQTSPPSEPTTGAPYRLASDPIYESKRWWEHTNPQPMEHQYGAFEQLQHSVV